MRRPTDEALDGIRQLLERMYDREISLSAAEDAAAEWLDNDVLQALDEGRIVEIAIDPDARDKGDQWCAHCPGNGAHSCDWYDEFDTPVDGPDVLELDCFNPVAPELCPLRTKERAVLVRARS
jgi:hypothetical protein